MGEILFPRMAVIGCGLIGSSVILAAREAGAVGEVIVADLSEAHRGRIVELGYADRVTGDIAEAVEGADLVVFAVPVLAILKDLAAGEALPDCASNVNAAGVTANCGAGVTFKVTATVWGAEPAGGVKVSVPV